MAEAKLNKLKVKRNTLIAQQQRVKEFVDSKLSEASIQELELRSEALEKYYSDFGSVQSAIEELDSSDVKDNTRAAFEELYFVLRPSLMVAMGKFKQDVCNESTSQVAQSSPLKLPKIPLPTFSGDYTQWLSYYETFSALVHRNTALDNVTRFHYLLSSLKDSALKRVQSLEVTSKNYDAALKLLVDRYQKRNLIIREHIRQLLNLPSISNKATASVLRDLIDTVNIHLRALTSLGRPVAHWDDLIVELILSKLDNISIEKWNDDCPTDRVPALDDLMKFLDKRCNYLEDISPVYSQAVTNTKKSVPKIQRSSFVASEQPKLQRFCTYCKSNNHLIYRCYQYLALLPKQRFDAIHQRNLCNNCLKTGHTHQNCTAEKCRTCKKLHHTSLHDNSFYVNAQPAAQPVNVTNNTPRNED